MPNNKTKIEELFSLTKESGFYSSESYELFKSIPTKASTQKDQAKPDSKQIALFQDKLNTSYGL